MKLSSRSYVFFQVFDIFDDTNLEKLNDPSCWLQDIILKSSVKIVLVLSPLIVDCLHALVSDDAKPGNFFNSERGLLCLP